MRFSPSHFDTALLDPVALLELAVIEARGPLVAVLGPLLLLVGLPLMVVVLQVRPPGADLPLVVWPVLEVGSDFLLPLVVELLRLLGRLGLFGRHRPHQKTADRPVGCWLVPFSLS